MYVVQTARLACSSRQTSASTKHNAAAAAALKAWLVADGGATRRSREISGVALMPSVYPDEANGNSH